MPRTREGAPPCSGPDMAPTAADRLAAASAPGDATTRAVNGEAFMPCSAPDGPAGSPGCAGRGHAPRCERGGVHAVLRRRCPVGVHRLHVTRIRLTAPAGHEA